MGWMMKCCSTPVRAFLTSPIPPLRLRSGCARRRASLVAFLSKKSGGVSDGWSIGSTPSRISLTISGGGTAASNFTITDMNDDACRHVAFAAQTSTTVSGDNDVLPYVNGVLEDGGQSSGGQVYTPNAEPVRLCTNVTQWQAATIDDVRIYSGVLSAERLLALANSKMRGLQVMGSLVSYVPLTQVATGAATNGIAFVDLAAASTVTPNDGANNTGMTANTTSVVLMSGRGVE